MKTFLIFSLVFAIMFMVGGKALAVELVNPIGAGDIPTLIDKIATWLLEIGATISTIIILWSALIFMTSGGNKDKVTQARKTLWYAIIGIVILLVAKGITSIIKGFLSGSF